MSDIIRLPAVTDELLDTMWRAWVNETCEGHRDVLAALEAYLSAVVYWQPIAESDIRPGMRVRAVYTGSQSTDYSIFAVELVDESSVYATDYGRGVGAPYTRGLYTWFVDPRSISHSLDRSLVAELREWVDNPEDAPAVLDRLREIANITPKENDAA